MNNRYSFSSELSMQIVEFKAPPSIYEYAPWEIPYIAADAEDDDQEETTADIPSIIGPDEPFDPDAKPEIDPAPPQPELPTPPAHPNVPPRINNPPHSNIPPVRKDSDDPAEPTELPPHISPIH